MSDFRRILLAGLKPLDPNTVPETHKIYYTASEQLPNPKFIRVGYHSYDSNSGEGMIVSYKPITSIGHSAFQNCSSMTTITIPDSVTSIGDWAFYGCISLKSITIPDGVTSIGGSAFYECSSLTNITIPEGITSIGSYTFWACSSLTSITIPDNVTSIGGSAFYGCTGELIINSKIIAANYNSNNYPSTRNGWLYGSNFTKLTIGNNITSIGQYTFYNCTSLTNVIIPDSVISIEGYAFTRCTSLTSITIPDSVTSIEWDAFSLCNSLTEVYCKPTTPPMGDSTMFDGNSSGRIIYVPTASVDAYKLASGWSNYANSIVGYDFE